MAYKDVTHLLIERPNAEEPKGQYTEYERITKQLNERKKNVLNAYYAGEGWKVIALAGGCTIRRIKDFVNEEIRKERLVPRGLNQYQIDKVRGKKKLRRK